MFDELMTLAATPSEDGFQQLAAQADEAELTEAQWTELERAVAAWPADVERLTPMPWIHETRAPVGDLQSWRLCNTLRLSGAVGRENVEAILDTPTATLKHIEHLQLWSGLLQDADVADLLSAPQFAAVRTISVNGPRIGAASVRALTTSLRNLQHLNVSGASFGDVGFARLLDAVWLRSLTKLALSEVSLTESSAALLAATEMPALEMLCVTDRIGSAGALALARSASFCALTGLSFYGCDIDDAGAAELAAVPELARLTWLDLQENPLTERGIAAITASPHLREVAVHLSPAVPAPEPVPTEIADLPEEIRDALVNAKKYLENISVGERDYRPWFAALSPHYEHAAVNEVLLACIAAEKVSPFLTESPLPDAWLADARKHVEGVPDFRLLAALVRRGYPPALDEARSTDDLSMARILLETGVPGAAAVFIRVMRARTDVGSDTQRAFVEAAAPHLSPAELFEVVEPWISSGQQIASLFFAVREVKELDARWVSVALARLNEQDLRDSDRDAAARILSRCPFTDECRDYALANMPLGSPVIEVWAEQPEIVEAVLAHVPNQADASRWLDAAGSVVLRNELTESQMLVLRERLRGVVEAITEPSDTMALELMMDALVDLDVLVPWSTWIEAAAPRILEGPHGEEVLARLRELVAS